MYNVKKLVKDSILVALMCVYLMLIIFTGLIEYSSVLCFFISLLICFYFKDKPVVRCLTACIAVLIISFILFGIIKLIAFIFPAVLTGFASKFLIKINSKKLKYLIFIISYFIIEIITVIFEARLYFNITLKDYIFDDAYLEIAPFIGNNGYIFVFCFFMALLVIGIMKVLIMDKFEPIYEKRLKNIVEGNDN